MLNPLIIRDMGMRGGENTYTPGIRVVLRRWRPQKLVVEAVHLVVVLDQLVSAICLGAHGCVAVYVATYCISSISQSNIRELVNNSLATLLLFHFFTEI